MASFAFRYITAKDGTRLRVGVFEPEKKSRRVCLLLNGHTEFIEKYLEVAGELNGRGFVVVAFDWRGQGGSARPLSDPMKSYVGDFAEYDEDLASVMAQVVPELSRAAPLLLAHSMGGHLALRALHGRADAFRGAVLVSPMIALQGRGVPVPFARFVTRWRMATGGARKFAWGMAKRDPLKEDFSVQLCTSDAARFARTKEILKSHPAIRLGGPTWGWLAAAGRSMDELKAPGFAEAITAPALIVAAGKDLLVRVEETRRFAARLPRGTYVEIAEARHEILMEQDAIRARFWQEFDGFAAQVLPL